MVCFVMILKIDVAVGKYLVDANTDVNITINKDKYRNGKQSLNLNHGKNQK